MMLFRTIVISSKCRWINCSSKSSSFIRPWKVPDFFLYAGQCAVRVYSAVAANVTSAGEPVRQDISDHIDVSKCRYSDGSGVAGLDGEYDCHAGSLPFPAGDADVAAVLADDLA